MLAAFAIVLLAARSRSSDVDPTVTIIALVVLFGGGIIWQVVQSNVKAAEEREIASRRQTREDHLRAKYGRGDVADKIVAGVIWVGESVEQLTDSLGRPEDIDEKVLKTKRKEVWKYGRRGANRYGLRINVEDGAVVGWDEKL